MTRIFWIVGLSIALVVNAGFVAICCTGLVTRWHLNLMGWLMLLLSAYLVRLIYGWLRSAIKYGDPTRDTNASLAR